MRVGFTGTRKGCTEEQKKTLKVLLNNLTIKYHKLEFHHGDCLGADSQAHDIVKEYNNSIPLLKDKTIPLIEIHIHPPIIPNYRAHRVGDVIHEEKDYILRNHDIVNSSDLLFAIPKGFNEETRSGTWATIRYARKLGKEIYIIYPDGRLNKGKIDVSIW